jgi:hypothetical protein
MSGSKTVSLEAIVSGTIVEPDVQPRNPGSCGAEPDGPGTDPPRHRLSDELPEGMLLWIGRPTDERRIVDRSGTMRQGPADRLARGNVMKFDERRPRRVEGMSSFRGRREGRPPQAGNRHWGGSPYEHPTPSVDMLPAGDDFRNFLLNPCLPIGFELSWPFMTNPFQFMVKIRECLI